ncbi:MAG: tetratricopeptide repeat protein [Rhodospirillaceae bacterium]|nr:tetratricopeptide repeat protein [Rhodospirillales bacterium]
MPADIPASGRNRPLNATVKYNPHLWGPEELRAIFVVRNTELNRLVENVRAVKPGATPQHVLITGPRGMGKSTLLRRLALAIEEDQDLSRQWVALTFPEEQYTVSTLAEFWFNVLDALADTLERHGLAAAELGQLDASIHHLGTLPVGDREAAALDLLTRWIGEHDRRILLLIDSTDLLFATLGANDGERKGAKATDASATTLWRLRKTLTHQPGIFWLGASYQALESRHQYHDAFLDFFDLVELRPLSVEEMRQAMLALARTFGVGGGLTGDAAEKEMARTLDARPERLKALRAMTGGNPRTTVMLYDLFAAGGDEDVYSDLHSLLDMMTPLYKARMESLADQPRKLLAHVMEHWAPLSARTLAEISGVPSSTISGQIARLETEGLVEKTRLPGKKSTGIQASERFFNVWYLMRYAPRRMRQRLTWLVEFMRLWYSADELAGLARHRAAYHAEGHLCDCANLEYSRAVAASLPDARSERHRLEWTVFSAATADTLKELFDLSGDDKQYATAADYRCRLHALDAKLALCPHVTNEDMEDWIKAVKGSIAVDLPRKERIAESNIELSSHMIQELRLKLQDGREKFIKFFGEPAVEAVEQATLKGNFFPECPDEKLAFSQLIACFDGNASAFKLGLDIFSGEKPQSSLLEQAYRKAIELDPKSAYAWNGLGKLLRNHLLRYDEAEQAYRKAIEIDPKFADAWNGLGNLLQDNLSRYDEAEQAYRKASEINPNFAHPWNGLGGLLQDHLMRYDEAEQAYRKASELNPNFAHPWNGLGRLLQNHLMRYDEAEQAYRKAVEIDPKFAYAWNGLGNLLQDNLSRYDEAEQAYRKAIELDPRSAHPWNDLGNLLRHPFLRYGEAEQAYRKAIELDPNFAHPWNALGNLLQDHFSRYDEAEQAYRRAIELDPRSAHAWNGLGNLLQDHLLRYDEAEQAYRKAIKLHPNSAHPWNGLGNLLQDHLLRYDEAERAYRKAIELNPNFAHPWTGLGDLLQDLNRPSEAEQAYRKAMTLDDRDPYPILNLGRLLSMAGRRKEATESYRYSAELAQTEIDSTADITNLAGLLLQSHLWLGNHDLALQALDSLAQIASAGDRWAFFRLMEQARECHEIGLGKALRDLMEESQFADFLQPFSLALHAAALGDADSVAAAPPEVQALAQEVLDQLLRSK